VERLERRMIGEAIEAEGSFAAAARVLGTTERVIRYKVRKLGIRATGERQAPTKLSDPRRR
jgi:transcriptional regulator with GAF, ATPase, and Fis domain